MRRIEWDRVLFARPHVINGTVDRLRVAGDDDSIVLFGDWVSSCTASVFEHTELGTG